VADHLAGGPRPVEDLAAATGTHAPSLARTLRALVVKGVFEEPEPGLFRLTEVGQLLRTEHPLSMRWAFRLFPDVMALAELGHTVRTGEPAFEHVYGQGYFEYLAAHPELHTEFHESQMALTRLELLSVLRGYRWSELGTLVDLGGGSGTFLSRVLARNPRLRGTLFDLEETAATAPSVMAEAGVADRCEIVHGNLFTDPLPAGADAYTIKRVLVGFDDEVAVRVLRSVRQAMRRDSRLLVLEPMMHEGARELSVTLDVRTLVLVQGRVRRPEEFAKVLDAAGLRVTEVAPRGLLTLIEARPE
jgi:hypothetical protein